MSSGSGGPPVGEDTGPLPLGQEGGGYIESLGAGRHLLGTM